MTDQLLTDDELTAITGRWSDTDAFCSRYTASVLYSQARKDIPALLAHIDAQAAENARLRARLAARRAAAAPVRPGGALGHL